MKLKKNGNNTDLKFRLTCLEQLSEVLSDSKREYSLLMAEEMGKPFKQGIGEIENVFGFVITIKKFKRIFRR